MTELFGTVLLRVTLAGLASAAAIAIAQDSALKEITRFAAGLLMLLAFLQPLLRCSLTVPDLGSIAAFRKDVEDTNMQTAMGAMGDSISRSLTKRAAEQGVDCTFSVLMETDTNGTLQIARVCVYFRPGETRVDEIGEMIQKECGVSAERIELVEVNKE